MPFDINKVVIREAEHGDYECVYALQKLLFDLHKQNRPDLFKDDIICPYSKEEFNNTLNGADIMLVAEYNGRVIGFVNANEEGYKNRPAMKDNLWLHIHDLAVFDEFARCGVGTLLFNAVKERAKALGLSRIELNVWGFNKSAERFYTALGMSVKTERLEINL